MLNDIISNYLPKSIKVEKPYKVSDLHSISASDSSIEWKLFNIPVGNFKSYEVYACEVNSEVYIKPSKIYLNREFEELFNFGLCCSNYDENKVVWVKNASLA